MARKAGQGEEEEVAQSREAESEKTPVHHEEKKPACHGGGHHVVEQASGDHHRKPRLVTMQRFMDNGESSPSGYIYKTDPKVMTQKTSQKMGQKVYKNQNSRKSAMKQSLLEIAV
ncbi:hypothetical protein STEG23_014541 [Scotinomys teguina]